MEQEELRRMAAQRVYQWFIHFVDEVVVCDVYQTIFGFVVNFVAAAWKEELEN